MLGQVDPELPEWKSSSDSESLFRRHITVPSRTKQLPFYIGGVCALIVLVIKLFWVALH
jgi:hypothetical protein